MGWRSEKSLSTSPSDAVTVSTGTRRGSSDRQLPDFRPALRHQLQQPAAPNRPTTRAQQVKFQRRPENPRPRRPLRPTQASSLARLGPKQLPLRATPSQTRTHLWSIKRYQRIPRPGNLQVRRKTRPTRKPKLSAKPKKQWTDKNDYVLNFTYPQNNHTWNRYHSRPK